LVCIDDRIDICVDFTPVLSTNSPDDALALLIAMHTIFELSFDKKSRTIRLLYSVLHGDKRFLSNSIRNLIKEKNIDIYCEQKYILSSSSSNLQSSSSTTQPQAQSQIDINSLRESAVQQNSPAVSQTSNARCYHSLDPRLNPIYRVIEK
jgi:hypothetical protein